MHQACGNWFWGTCYWLHTRLSSLSHTQANGIGYQLMNSVEEWLRRHGAQYIFLATESDNTASKKSFHFQIQLHEHQLNNHICATCEKYLLRENIKIEKLHVDQAISLYESKLTGKDMFPADMDVILKENISMGTWVCYFDEQGWVNLDSEENNQGKSWIIFSIWNACEDHNLHMKKSQTLGCFHATLSHAKEKLLSWLKMPQSNTSLESSLGFLFLYGIYGEGEHLGELMKSLWNFALAFGQKVKNSKVVITEMGLCDPLLKHVPENPSITCIHDLWYAKSLSSCQHNEQDDLLTKGPLENVFVDPREF